MKPLLPALRDKKRYLAFEAISKEDMEPSRIFNEFSGKFRHLYGAIALSRSNLRLMPEFSKKNKGIIRVNRKYVDKVQASMCLLTQVNGVDVILRTILVSGSIAKFKEE